MKVITHDLPQFDELRLYVLSDVHFEDKHCNKKRLMAWRNEVESEENHYVVINGDIVNAATRNSVSDIYSAQSSPDQALDDIVDFLEPIKDRILVIIDGNHEGRVKKEAGIKPLKRVARELGIGHLYADDAYLLYVSFGKSQKRNARKMVYSIYGMHGSGGGKKVGGKINALVSLGENIDADVYIMSHTHQPVILPRTFYRCDYRNKKVTPIEKMYINSNAFLDFGGYGEALGFSPPSLRYPVVIMNGYERYIKAEI